jgi:hypothetical protein
VCPPTRHAILRALGRGQSRAALPSAWARATSRRPRAPREADGEPSTLRQDDRALEDAPGDRAKRMASLQRFDGNVAAVARDMNKATMQVYRWMRRLGVDPKGFR